MLITDNHSSNVTAFKMLITDNHSTNVTAFKMIITDNIQPMLLHLKC